MKKNKGRKYLSYDEFKETSNVEATNILCHYVVPALKNTKMWEKHYCPICKKDGTVFSTEVVKPADDVKTMNEYGWYS